MAYDSSEDNQVREVFDNPSNPMWSQQLANEATLLWSIFVVVLV